SKCLGHGVIQPAETSTRTLDVRTTRPAGRSHGAIFSRTLKDTAAGEPGYAQPPATPAGFVRSGGPSAPGHVPRFTSVPEAAQWPLGPYKQAPAEGGGEWSLVHPFSGPEPWVRAAEIAAGPSQAETVQIPDGFEKLFGPRPDRSDFSSRGEYVLRVAVWERNLADFEGVGIPERHAEEQVSAAVGDMKQWGMGEPVFYKGRDGWKARFPDSELPKFEISAETAIKAPQVTAGVYHVQ